MKQKEILLQVFDRVGNQCISLMADIDKYGGL